MKPLNSKETEILKAFHDVWEGCLSVTYSRELRHIWRDLPNHYKAGGRLRLVRTMKSLVTKGYFLERKDHWGATVWVYGLHKVYTTE